MSNQSNQPSKDNPDTVVELTLRDYNELQRMAVIVTDLQSRIENMKPIHPAPEPRVSEPEHFNGHRSQLRDFISQVKLVIQAQPSRFSTEKQKVIYAATFLRGPAFSWFQPYTEMADTEPILNNFNMFIRELKCVFGDPSQSATAERQLRNLKQKGAAANYVSDFRRLASLVEWNDAALCHQFYHGLKDNVKDFLVNYDIQ